MHRGALGAGCTAQPSLDVEHGLGLCCREPRPVLRAQVADGELARRKAFDQVGDLRLGGPVWRAHVRTLAAAAGSGCGPALRG